MLQSLNTAPTRAAEIVNSLPDEAHGWKPSAEEWSIGQLVAHLAAAEQPFRERLNRILQEDKPWLPYFGPDVARPDFIQSMPQVLARFRAERAALIEFLSARLPQDWERPATHETMGPTTFALQVQNLINHDTEHLGQMDEICRAWEKVQAEA